MGRGYKFYIVIPFAVAYARTPGAAPTSAEEAAARAFALDQRLNQTLNNESRPEQLRWTIKVYNPRTFLDLPDTHEYVPCSIRSRVLDSITQYFPKPNIRVHFGCMALQDSGEYEVAVSEEMVLQLYIAHETGYTDRHIRNFAALVWTLDDALETLHPLLFIEAVPEGLSMHRQRLRGNCELSLRSEETRAAQAAADANGSTPVPLVPLTKTEELARIMGCRSAMEVRKLMSRPERCESADLPSLVYGFPKWPLESGFIRFERLKPTLLNMRLQHWFMVCISLLTFADEHNRDFQPFLERFIKREAEISAWELLVELGIPELACHYERTIRERMGIVVGEEPILECGKYYSDDEFSFEEADNGVPASGEPANGETANEEAATGENPTGGDPSGGAASGEPSNGEIPRCRAERLPEGRPPVSRLLLRPLMKLKGLKNKRHGSGLGN